MRTSFRESFHRSQADAARARVHRTYARARRDEWREYNTVVGEWERERYLHLW